MVYFEVELMAITSYEKQINGSHQIDISRESILRPLQKYDIREAHVNRGVRGVRYDYSVAGYRDTSINSYYRSREHSTVEITFDRAGLEKLSVDLYKMQEEEWLRKNNPSLQKAWEHYQTVLGLVK
jgi:hypothetical protein